MKKLFTTVLCLGLMSVNLASFADEASAVKLNCTNVELKSSLKNKYAAYRIECFNTGKNPVRVSDVKCYNKVAMADYYSDFRITKKTMVCSLLALPTLGLSNFIGAPDALRTSGNLMQAQNEAKRFNALDVTGTNSGNNLPTSNEVLVQGQSVEFNVLVPLNESPDVSANLEDTVSHQYIRVQSAK